jgi:hypothetical protein
MNADLLEERQNVAASEAGSLAAAGDDENVIEGKACC